MAKGDKNGKGGKAADVSTAEPPAAPVKGKKPGSGQPILPPEKSSAERVAEMADAAGKLVAEAAALFLKPADGEVPEAVAVPDGPVDEMVLEEIEAELELIGDPFARRLALGAHRGALIVARDRALEAMNNLIGVCEDAIHTSREAEGKLQNRQAELVKAKERIAFEAAEEKRIAAENKEGEKRAARAKRLMTEDA